MAQQISLKGRALRLLGNREHSRLELQRKLIAHVRDGTELDAVLDELQARGFINEQRVVESVLHQRAGKLGAARVRQEMQKKGLSPLAVNAAVAQLQGSELARAHAVWARKFADQDPGADAALAATVRARQVRFLAARGFARETIRRVISGLSEDELQGLH